MLHVREYTYNNYSSDDSDQSEESLSSSEENPESDNENDCKILNSGNSISRRAISPSTSSNVLHSQYRSIGTFGSESLIAWSIALSSGAGILLEQARTAQR